MSLASVSTLERMTPPPPSLGSPPPFIHGQQHPPHTDTPALHDYRKMYIQKHSFIFFMGGAWTYSWMMVLVLGKGQCCPILLLMVST